MDSIVPVAILSAAISRMEMDLARMERDLRQMRAALAFFTSPPGGLVAPRPLQLAVAETHPLLDKIYSLMAEARPTPETSPLKVEIQPLVAENQAQVAETPAQVAKTQPLEAETQPLVAEILPVAEIRPLVAPLESPVNQSSEVPQVKKYYPTKTLGKGDDVMLSGLDQLPIIQCGDFVLQLELGELHSGAKEIARKELRETPELVRDSIDELRALLKEDPDVRVPLDNEPWLVRFLRPCKYYPESAYELIKKYYSFKIKHHDVYDNLLPSREENVFKQNILCVMPNRDQFGRRMLLIELGKKWKPSKCTLEEVFKGCVLLMEAAMLEPETQVAGAVVIFDMDGLSLNQVWQFTPPFAKRIVDWLQDSVPARIKGLHAVNQPYIFNMVFALFKPFLRDKLKSRIVFHGTDRKSLHQYISPKCLPQRYGGTLDLPQISGNTWLELLLKCDAEYEAINSYGYKKTYKKK